LKCNLCSIIFVVLNIVNFCDDWIRMVQLCKKVHHSCLKIRKTCTNKDKWLAGVQLYGGPKASAMLNISEASSLHHEYSSLACTIEIVEDVFAAIDHINKHGRHVLRIIFIFLIIITNFIVSKMSLLLYLMFLQCSYWMHCHRRLWSSWDFLKSSWQVCILFLVGNHVWSLFLELFILRLTLPFPPKLFHIPESYWPCKLCRVTVIQSMIYLLI
jgi:hypothetical protein